MVVAVTGKNNKFGLNQCEKFSEGRVAKQYSLVNLSFLTRYFPSFRARSCFLKLCSWSMEMNCFLYQLIDQNVSVLSKIQKTKPQGFSECSLNTWICRVVHLQKSTLPENVFLARKRGKKASSNSSSSPKMLRRPEFSYASPRKCSSQLQAGGRCPLCSL